MNAGTYPYSAACAAFASQDAMRQVPATTQGLPARIGERVLLIADAENLSYGLRKQGFDLDFRRLREMVAARCIVLYPHAFATVPGTEAQRYAQNYFSDSGWEHLVECAQTVGTCRGTEQRANSDSCILLGCGELAERLQPDAVVLATGDGDLGCDMAKFLKRRGGATRIFVCSICGSTSQRLRAAHNVNVDGNLWLGRDCMVQFH